MRIEILKRAGYTHMMKYQRFHKDYGWMDASFPTTADAVCLHLKDLEKSPDVRKVEVQTLA